MIINTEKPYTGENIEKLKEEFETYVKIVIDVKKNICSAGANRHFESEKLLIDGGSNQNDLWGGGVDVEAREINIDSMINIRPQFGNRSNQIQEPKTREVFEGLTKYFFPTIFNDR